LWLWDVFELIKSTGLVTFDVTVDGAQSREAARAAIANKYWRKGERQNGVLVSLVNVDEIDRHVCGAQLDIESYGEDEGYVSGYGYRGIDFTAKSLLKDADRRCHTKYEDIILQDVLN
jgi:hypothetical protein